jgi:hypothetical protein
LRARYAIEKPGFDRSECDCGAQRLDRHGASEAEGEAHWANVQPIRRTVLEIAEGQIPSAGTDYVKNPILLCQVAPDLARATTWREMVSLGNRLILGSLVRKSAGPDAALLVKYAARALVAAGNTNTRETK